MVHSEGDAASIPVVDINAADAAHVVLQAAIDYGFIFVRHADLALTPMDVDRLFALVRLWHQISKAL